MRFHDRYPLRAFQERDTEKLKHVITAYPLATLISQGESFPTVSQIPLLIDSPGEKLRGHLDRNNPHCAHILAGGGIYCLFHGPNHYMSPTIYPDPHFPGWNYVTVHVRGTARPIEDIEWLTELLLDTARANEPPGSGYQLTPSQENFDVFIRYILGFEIEIADMKGVVKLAQDKGREDAERARQHLAHVMKEDIGEFLGKLLEDDGHPKDT